MKKEVVVGGMKVENEENAVNLNQRLKSKFSKRGDGFRIEIELLLLLSLHLYLYRNFKREKKSRERENEKKKNWKRFTRSK